MKRLRTIGLLLAALLVSACGGSNVCEKPKAYQKSQPGKRIEAPEGLNSLNANREMSIPDASPRDPPPEGARCLELPPTFVTEDQERNPAG